MTEHDGQDEVQPTLDEELEVEDGEVLPRREVMSILDLGDSGPIYTLPVEPNN